MRLMYLLRIEHKAADYEGWKAAFDSDPVDRAGKGVRRYQILRADDDADFVCIELTFETREQAEALLAAMREVWARITGSLIEAPTIRTFQLAEEGSY
jgi:hypothetical protein